MLIWDWIHLRIHMHICRWSFNNIGLNTQALIPPATIQISPALWSANSHSHCKGAFNKYWRFGSLTDILRWLEGSNVCLQLSRWSLKRGAWSHGDFASDYLEPKLSSKSMPYRCILHQRSSPRLILWSLNIYFGTSTFYLSENRLETIWERF